MASGSTGAGQHAGEREGEWGGVAVAGMWLPSSAASDGHRSPNIGGAISWAMPMVWTGLKRSFLSGCVVASQMVVLGHHARTRCKPCRVSSSDSAP
jgi:hypothetical protein